MTIRNVSRLSGLFLAAVVCVPAQRQESTREIRKQEAWKQGQQVQVSHRMGDLVVRGAPVREVQVFALVRASASTQEEAAKLAAQIDVTVQSTPNAILVTTRYPDESSWFRSSRASYSVRLEVNMPATAALNAQSSFGRTEVSGLRAGAEVTNKNGPLRVFDGAGEHKLSCSFGDTDVSDIRGPVHITNTNGASSVTRVDELTLSNRFGKTSVQTVARGASIEASNGAIDVFDVGGETRIIGAFGAIQAARIKGGITLRNQNGNVEVRTVGGPAQISSSFGAVSFTDMGGSVTATGQNGKITGLKAAGPVDVKNSFGTVQLSGIRQGAKVVSGNAPVELEDVGGEVFVQTSFGAARVTRATGPVTVENRNGAVRIEDAKGAVKAQTTFGPIEIQGAGGAVEATADNGSIVIAGLVPKCHPVTAKTRFGSLRVALPAGVGYDVTAATTFGRVKSDFEVTLTAGTPSEGRLEGKIAGGGCPLRLTNSNGSIEIGR